MPISGIVPIYYSGDHLPAPLQKKGKIFLLPAAPAHVKVFRLRTWTAGLFTGYKILYATITKLMSH